MAYKMDMSGEKEKGKLLPEGWREFEILECSEETSKAGNEMFKFKIIDIELQQEEEIYAIATQGKRWFLKQILTACGVEAGQDGVYEWDIPDVLTKTIMGKVEHQQETWIDREGKSRTTPKHKIVEVKAVGMMHLFNQYPIVR